MHGRSEIVDNFKIIYKILSTIEQSMDYEEFDPNAIMPESLGVSRARWESIVTALVQDGYITGVELLPIMGKRMPQVRLIAPRLTLAGMEYLADNTMMKKAYRLAKGIKDIIPGA